MKLRQFANAVALASAVTVTRQAALGDTVQIRVTVENLAPANSVSFAPLRFGFGSGTFDTFNQGAVAFNTGDIAAAPIVSIAEGGSGSTWLPAFAAAEPAANINSLTGAGGPFLPGGSNSGVFTVNTSNRYFTFGSMVVPSNDHFVGNDDPKEYEVFDTSGNLILPGILQKANEIWDAGSETENPLNAAFLVGGTNSLRENENGVVSFNFTDLSAFNGLTTAAGYTFNSNLLAPGSDVLRISFAIVPEPATASLASLAVLGCLTRRRR